MCVAAVLFMQFVRWRNIIDTIDPVPIDEAVVTGVIYYMVESTYPTHYLGNIFLLRFFGFLIVRSSLMVRYLLYGRMIPSYDTFSIKKLLRR